MNAQRLEELIISWEEDSLTAEELTELKHLLATEPLARQRLVAAGVLQNVAEGRVRMWETLEQTKPAPTAQVWSKVPGLSWFSWRPLTAAAAGIIFGMLCTSVVLAYASPTYANAKVVVRHLWNESFESGVHEIAPGLPSTPNVWSGDEARIVPAEKGVQPKSGGRMLRFVSASFTGENAKRSAWGDVYRLVDLRGQVPDGKAAVRLSASFDAAPFSPGEEFSCSLELCALEEDPANAPQPLTLPWARENSSSVAARKVPMKGDGAWQDVTVEVSVSPQTRFVLAHLAVARRKPGPPAEPVQFSGHYLDDVKLELLTKQSAL